MTKLLIIILVTTFIEGCVFPPPDRLRAERERHAKEMKALQAAMYQVEQRLDTTKSELEVCRTDLEAQRALRNDHQHAVAYVQWCDVFGSAFGMCNDALYFDGVAAFQAGERASGEWQARYYGITSIVVGILFVVMSAIAWLAWDLVSFLRSYIPLQEAKEAKENLRTLRNYYSQTSKALSEAEERLADLSEEIVRAEEELRQQKSELASAVEDLGEVCHLRSMLDV